MWRAKHTTTAPPGGWRYLQSETGVAWSEKDDERIGHSIDHLAGLIAEHRRASNIDPGDPADEIQDYTAQNLDEATRVLYFETAPESVKRSTAQRINGAVAVAAIAARKLEELPIHVEEPAAIDRARACLACIYNVPNIHNGRIQAMENSEMHRLLDGSQLPEEIQAGLKTCSRCSCENATAVWYHPEIFDSATPTKLLQNLPNNCWKKREVAELRGLDLDSPAMRSNVTAETTNCTSCS